MGAATILYMALPRSQRLSQLFGVRKDTLSGGALRGNIVMRLRHTAEALSQVHTSVEEISQKLSAVCAPSLQGVYDRAVEAVCAGCSARAAFATRFKTSKCSGTRGKFRGRKTKRRFVSLWTTAC